MSASRARTRAQIALAGANRTRFIGRDATSRGNCEGDEVCVCTRSSCSDRAFQSHCRASSVPIVSAVSPLRSALQHRKIATYMHICIACSPDDNHHHQHSNVVSAKDTQKIISFRTTAPRLHCSFARAYRSSPIVGHPPKKDPTRLARRNTPTSEECGTIKNEKKCAYAITTIQYICMFALPAYMAHKIIPGVDKNVGKNSINNVPVKYHTIKKSNVDPNSVCRRPTRQSQLPI